MTVVGFTDFISNLRGARSALDFTAFLFGNTKCKTGSHFEEVRIHG